MSDSEDCGITIKNKIGKKYRITTGYISRNRKGPIAGSDLPKAG